MRISAQHLRHRQAPSPEPWTPQDVKHPARTKSPRGRSPSGRIVSSAVQGTSQRCLYEFILSKVAFPRVLVLQNKRGMQIRRKVSLYRRVDAQPCRRSQKNGDKSTVAFLKDARQLGCPFQATEPPKSSSILRKSSNKWKPIRCVHFTTAVLCHAQIRDRKPSLGIVCPGDPHQRNPNAPKFEDRSQEETDWQERRAREAAWRLAKHILKLKEKHQSAFFSLTEDRCLPAPSGINPEEREFVADSGTSMHMISRKDLNSAEGNRKNFEKTNDGCNSQMEKCRRMKRRQFTSKIWIYS